MNDIFDQIHADRTAAKNPMHPLGEVKAYDYDSGLPIVKRKAISQPLAETKDPGNNPVTIKPSNPVEKPEAVDEKPAKPAAASPAEPKPTDSKQSDSGLKPASAGGARPMLKPAGSDLVKGQPVELADGSRGKVAHMVQNMNTARVRTDDGRNVTVRRNTLKQVLVKEHYRKAPQ